jgi:hypothetical protein
LGCGAEEQRGCTCESGDLGAAGCARHASVSLSSRLSAALGPRKKRPKQNADVTASTFRAFSAPANNLIRLALHTPTDIISTRKIQRKIVFFSKLAL